MANRGKIDTSNVVEEQIFRTDSVFLRARINRRLRLIRVVDYRAGFLPSKRLYLQMLAKKESALKVLIFVEKDEVSSWTKLGFAKEGSIPGFYKRSDAHLCGMAFDENGSAVKPITKPAAADKLVSDARKAAKKIKLVAKDTSLKELSEETAYRHRDEAWKKGNAFASFDLFEQDGQRSHYEILEDGKRINIVATEIRDCFGHAFLEILHRPEDAASLPKHATALEELIAKQEARGVLSTFTFSPADDSLFATLLSSLKFRRTGFVQQGMSLGGQDSDVFVWARKNHIDDID